MQATLVVEGMNELRAALKKADAEIGKNLDRQLGRVARGMATLARQRLRIAIATYGARKKKRPNYKRGSAARSVKITKGRGRDGKGVYFLQGGGTPTTEHFGWVEFGGTLHATGKRTNTQKRPFVPNGRSIFPTAENASPLMAAGIEQAMNDAMRPFL